MKNKSKSTNDKSTSKVFSVKGLNRSIVNFKPTLGSDEPMRHVGQSPAAQTLGPNSSDKKTYEDGERGVNEAVLDITQRRKRSNMMRRMAKKLARLRAVARNQMAPESRLRRRAQKMARSIIRSRFAGARGKKYSDLSASDKIAVDKLIQNKSKLIARVARRIVPIVRKAEQLRLQGVRKHKKPQSISNSGLGIRREDYEFEADMLAEGLAVCILEGKSDRMDQLLRAGLADRDSIAQYKKALADPDLSKRYSQLRDKIFDMLEKLSDAVTSDSTLFYRAKDNIRKKHNFDKNDDKKSMSEQELIEATINRTEIHSSLKNPASHPSQEANKKVAAKLKTMHKPVAKKPKTKKPAKPLNKNRPTKPTSLKNVNSSSNPNAKRGDRHSFTFHPNGRMKSMSLGNR